VSAGGSEGGGKGGGGGRGGGARLVVPLLAAAMIAISLERLAFLHWVPAAALFVILAFFVFGTAARQRKALREHMDRAGEADHGAD